MLLEPCNSYQNYSKFLLPSPSALNLRNKSESVVYFSISFNKHSDGSTDSLFVFVFLIWGVILMRLLVQEEGWPLGLRFLNSRIGLLRNGSGSVSFSTILTGSSTDSSSDLDTESTESFFHDKSITLGNLIGVSSFLELSRRSTRGRMAESSKDNKRIHKLKPWLFSLCSRLSTDAVSGNDAPSLAHYLEAERRAASTYRRNQCPTTNGPNDFSPIQDSNLLLDGSQVGHHPSALDDDEGEEQNKEMEE
ncbi:hypothetical protein VNO77_19461 [Canavalia gladiata]|uniref:Uncharacterized protein n=1 Tax=Canavalia gladiata TaxID=3824 RepID=A0AAN9LQZ5_CANGL